MSASHRRSMSGLKVEETSKWGADTARARYGEPRDFHGAAPPKDREAPQSLGDAGAAGARPKGYFNDVPQNSWLRGGAKGGESMPGFDHLRGQAKRR